MMKTHRSRWLMLAAVVASPVLYYLYTLRVQPPPPLTVGEKQMVDSLFASTKPQCAGRFVFDVPVSFANSLDHGIAINDIRITSTRLYPSVFAQRLQLREEELKNTKTIDPEDGPYLKQVYRLSDNVVIFDRNRNQSVSGTARILEGHSYVDGVAFTLIREISDVSDPKYQEYKSQMVKDYADELYFNSKFGWLTEMKSLLSRLRGRQDDEIPTEPGTCIPQGFIRDDTGKRKEDITFVYPHNKIFSFFVSTNNWMKESTSMLERSVEIQSGISLMKGRSLRKGKTTVAGMEADEWLVAAPSEYEGEHDELGPWSPSGQLMFNLMLNEKTVDFHRPILNLTLSNNALPAPAYSDAQLVAIWDRLVGSFRLRPGAFLPQSHE